jgi:Ni/Co efflux regulator RcnB
VAHELAQRPPLRLAPLWRRWRDRNRSIFRLGFYFDPFGWGYHRWNIGWRLWPSYYSSNYWLDDPYMYRLPYAPWPYKWIRYYDDAILVNTYTGQVADVIYDFFW